MCKIAFEISYELYGEGKLYSLRSNSIMCVSNPHWTRVGTTALASETKPVTNSETHTGWDWRFVTFNLNFNLLAIFFSWQYFQARHSPCLKSSAVAFSTDLLSHELLPTFLNAIWTLMSVPERSLPEIPTNYTPPNWAPSPLIEDMKATISSDAIGYSENICISEIHVIYSK